MDTIISYKSSIRLYKMWLLTEITFLYKSGHHCLIVEQYLLPKFKTSLGLNIVISEYEYSMCVSSAQIEFECLQHCL